MSACKRYNHQGGCSCPPVADVESNVELVTDTAPVDTLDVLGRVGSPEFMRLVDIAQDPDAIDAYNEAVPLTQVLTPERIAFLSAPRDFINGVGVVRDLEGFAVRSAEGRTWRVSECCAASATGTEDYVGCRSCYAEVDPATGAAPEFVDQPAGWVAWGDHLDDEKRTAFHDHLVNALGGLTYKVDAYPPRLWSPTIIYLDHSTGEVATADETAFAEGTAKRQGQILARIEMNGTIDSSISGAHRWRVRMRDDGELELGSTSPRDDFGCLTPDCVLVEGHRRDCTFERTAGY